MNRPRTREPTVFERLIHCGLKVPVATGYRFSSDTNTRWLSVDELKEFLA